jgi:D-glycero-D-manno-heptose 1,7-bisphosphate phosphatase
MLSWIGNLQIAPRHFLFLDRDGVINWDRHDYVKSWSEFEFCPDTLSALRHLYQQHVGVIIVSNQSALHRGYIEWASFWHMHRQVIHNIRKAGGDILAAFYCPHRPDEGCSCRKPLPAMLWGAAKLLGITLQSTVMIGDRGTDVLAARQAGCRAVLLDRVRPDGSTSGAAAADSCVPDDRFPSLLDAARALYGDIPS